MKKNDKRRLLLSQEKVRELQDASLANVAGAWGGSACGVCTKSGATSGSCDLTG